MGAGPWGDEGKGTGNHLLVVDQAPCDFSELQNCHQQSQQFLGNENLGVSQQAPVVTSWGTAMENIQSPRGCFSLYEHRGLNKLIIVTTPPAPTEGNWHLQVPLLFVVLFSLLICSHSHA